MKIRRILFLLPFALFSCKDVEDKASESITNAVIEKSLEQAGIATENVERANKNEAQVELSLEGKHLFEKDVFKSEKSKRRNQENFSIADERSKTTHQR